MLILGRVLHGFGGGGLTSTGMVVLGDVAAPKDRGKYYGYFSVIYTTAGALGPALGGVIAEYLHWSVIFWMNMPLGLIALALTLDALRRLPRHDRPHKLDFLGAALIMAASSSLHAGAQHGRRELSRGFRRRSSALFAAALMLGIGFVRAAAHRARAADPALDPGDREARLAIAAQRLRLGRRSSASTSSCRSICRTSSASPPTNAGLSVMIAGGDAQRQRRHHRHVIRRVEHYKRIPMLGWRWPSPPCWRARLARRQA